MIVKIQECEALLTSATDKGYKISSEGSSTDRNEIMEQLSALKQQLHGLKREVEQRKEELESTGKEGIASHFFQKKQKKKSKMQSFS